MIKIILYVIILFVTSSCVTRLIMPAVEGNIYDVNNKAISEVEVCLNDECLKTNEQGHFGFKRKVKKEFVLVGGEAPAIIYDLKISKKSYNDTIIYYKNLFGGDDIDKTIKYKSILLKSEN